MKDEIKIRSIVDRELSTNVVINGKKYLILTEDLIPQKQLVNTRVYLEGKIISSRNLDCKNALDSPEPGKKIIERIREQHQMIVRMLKKEQEKRFKSPSKYLDEVKNMLQKKENKDALKLLVQALKKYPDDPFLLSYYGCLEAIIHKNYAFGIETCLRAINMLDETTPFGQEIFYPTFYLNLGRVHLAAQNRRDAVEAFQKGLSYDSENKDLLWEMKKIGARRKPVIPYLKRTNPINKYIGILLHRLSPYSAA
jgi:tetratricopeptide (TPR) repeat protein